MSKSQKYVIDATTLLSLAGASNIVWDTIIGLLESGRLLIPFDVWDRVKDVSPETFARISPFKEARLPSTDKVWMTATKFSQEYTTSLFAKSYDTSDYWVVAEAKVKKLVVVVANPASRQVLKLCKQASAAHVTLEKLVETEGPEED